MNWQSGYCAILQSAEYLKKPELSDDEAGKIAIELLPSFRKATFKALSTSEFLRPYWRESERENWLNSVKADVGDDLFKELMDEIESGVRGEEECIVDFLSKCDPGPSMDLPMLLSSAAIWNRSGHRHDEHVSRDSKARVHPASESCWSLVAGRQADKVDDGVNVQAGSLHKLRIEGAIGGLHERDAGHLRRRHTLGDQADEETAVGARAGAGAREPRQQQRPHSGHI